MIVKSSSIEFMLPFLHNKAEVLTFDGVFCGDYCTKPLKIPDLINKLQSS